jgi:outer membrane protein OmpA-like peptidoglycan-associated protein
MEYSFKLQPQSNLNVITLEAFYETPVLFPYCGNILLDHMSEIVSIPCNKTIPDKPRSPDIPDTEEKLTAYSSKNYAPSSGSSSSKSTSSTKTTRVPENQESPVEISGVKVEDFLKSDNELEIKNLAFEADSFNLKPSSYLSLNQIFNFLLANPNISLEIGGHTNSLPPAAICDSLSLRRARSVRNYLVDQGIQPERLKAVGYGKRRPLVSNKTITGRAKNQRVEIKIIKR